MNNIVTELNNELLPAEMSKQTFGANYLKLLSAKYPDMPREYLIDFLHKAQVTGASPVTNQIMLTPRKVKNKKTNQWETVGIVVFSYGYTLGIVQRHPEFKGLQTEIKMVKRTVFGKKFDEYGKDSLDFSSVKIEDQLAAVTQIYRGNTPYFYTAYLTDYYAKGNPNWNQQPETMLRKCAEVAACRHAFADCVQGFYTPEEFDNDDRIESQANVVIGEIAEEKRIEKNLNLPKTPDYDNVASLIEQIKEILGVLTRTKTPVEKMSFLFDEVGVKKFDDLKKMKEETLAKILQNLNQKLEDDMNAEIREKERIHGATS